MLPALRRVLAEFLGSAALTIAVVGSGIAAQQLSPHDRGLQLAENAAATALALYVIIVVLAPLSGAHLNPLVSAIDGLFGLRSWGEVARYALAQLAGCSAGAVLANLMFALPAVTISSSARFDGAHALAEVLATGGLIVVIFVLARSRRAPVIPAAVAAYIGAAYFFTSSTSFANPAITVGRMLTDSFSGIAPVSGLGFIAAQIVGAALGYVVVRILGPARPRSS